MPFPRSRQGTALDRDDKSNVLPPVGRSSSHADPNRPKPHPQALPFLLLADEEGATANGGGAT